MTILNDLTDVTITGPINGQRLVYENGEWINKEVITEFSQVWTQAYYDQVYASALSRTNSWVRNPSWLALPVVGSTEQKFVGLLAVWPEANFVALSAAGNYTVDWGDGVTENVASGVDAQHEYDFNDVDIANTNAPVTFQDTGDTVTRTAHGYTNGMTISFDSITTTTGIVKGQVYFVVNATANTFQVSATSGGGALALTNNGSGIILPYKQVIVTVTPQAGQNLTAFNLNVRHSQVGLQGYNVGWLDVMVGSPNFTGSGPIIGTLDGSEFVRKNSLERVRVVNLGTTTALNSRFAGLRKMVVIELPNTSAVTNMSAMFQNCSSLHTVPLLNTANVTSIGSMFSGCSRLQTVPLFNILTTGTVDMSGMFSSCSSLQTIPLFNTAAVTNMSSMFSSCRNLQTVPLFNTANVGNMSSMFDGCSSLQTVPLFNTTNAFQMAYMFNSCSSLQSIPLFNTTNVTQMSGMFSSCSSLQTVPLFNTVNATGMGNMFSSCSSLLSIPLFDTAKVTSMGSMFSSCLSLQSVPALVTNAVTSGNLASMFQSCFSLSRIEAKDFRFTFSVASCKLSATALNEIYTNLPTVTGQTITVTGNYGTAGDDPTIATAKGWTVTG
jgi:surface protein